MKRKSILTYFLLALVLLITVILVFVFFMKKNSDDIKVIKSEKELINLVKEENNKDIPKLLFTLPYSLTYNSYTNIKQSSTVYRNPTSLTNDTSISITRDSNYKTNTTNKEYSATNIQVENVDEADIVKTDGNYIYSITDEEVIITKVLDDGKVEIASKITNIGTPEDILINNDKLVVISDNYNSSINRTQIDIFDISDRTSPKKLKKINLDYDYYTSRMIDNNVYIFSSGYVETEDNKKIKPIYYCDDKDIDVDYTKISYIKNKKTDELTTILSLDLNNVDDISFNGIMVDLDNAYISENNIYISTNDYENDKTSPRVSDILGYKGIYGIFNELDDDEGYGKYTTIYKFNIDGKDLKYIGKVKEKGSTLNQFSMDEYQGNLRVTLSENNNENKLCIFNDKLEKIGSLTNIAPGEKLYSTRFMNDRAYMVTYKTIDPLFVVDVSNPYEPKILGELKIPGYSTYLHPYDENHIIGIGNDTKTTVTRNSQGKVTSERTTVTGMKMALFDVTDVNNPKEMFSTKIGDTRTYSSVLGNHKALLFSKEKNLLAIPINNYSADINVTLSSDNVSDSNISKKISRDRIKNGYLVYDISLENGFKTKGMITHDSTTTYSYYNRGQDVRGVYINDILYTISNKYIKANKLDDLQEIVTLKLY